MPDLLWVRFAIGWAGRLADAGSPGPMGVAGFWAASGRLSMGARGARNAGRTSVRGPAIPAGVR